MLPQREDELSRHQDQSKDTAHALHSADPQVFNIQALLLIKAIAMFDAAAQTPIGVDLLGDGYTEDGDAGQQGEGVGMQVVFSHQDPQLLMGFRQADEEPAHFEIGQVGTSGVLEGDLIGDLPENAVDQVLQVLGLPTV